MFAELIINSNVKTLNKTFDYIVPESMQNDIRVGSRVFVPFGNGKKLEDGFVINLKDKSEFANKEIAKIEIKDSISEENIELARLMSRKYFCNISDCIRLMLPPGTASKDASNRIKEKTGTFVYLGKSIDELEMLIDTKQIKSEKHIKVIRFLSTNEGIYKSNLESICEVSNAVLQTMVKHNYIKFKEEQMERNPFMHKAYTRDEAKKLTKEQKVCFDSIASDIDKGEFSENLIYGITGSGKTEIYLQLIDKVLKSGKDSIVLVPEISLTPQMVDRFLARFGDTIAVLHSRLSNGERFDEWKKIRNGDKKIVIGARSAIFAPVNNLGIIIIDEEHDISYKSDTTPRYSAKDLAGFICKNNNCPLVLGSATPDIITMYKAKNGKINLYTLTKRANEAKLPSVEIIDLRQELAMGNRSMLSFKLQDEIEKNLKDKKQTILYLNRRGYSTFVMCRDCGYVAKCKNCNISLTYHMTENKLKCHYCGYEEKLINVCPECSSKKIKYFGTGTQKLEKEINKLYPEASTIRMDIDTVSKKNSHEDILNTFKNDGIDILIGTQMVVKGHHFPNVTLVGVISADSSLNLDDYRAVERTFQTLVQVAGRSGREEAGRVVIQTYNPDHYAIIDSQKQDYDLFYNQEIELRKQLNYPPFCDIILVSFSGENLKNIQKVSDLVYRRINAIENNNMRLYKPVPSPIDKIKNKYRWRIIAKCKVTTKTLDIINFAINDERIQKCKDVRITVDINPNTMN